MSQRSGDETSGEERGGSPAPASLDGLDRRFDSETWLQIVFQNIPDVILTTDRDGTIRFMNYTVSRRPVETLLGTSAFEYLRGQDKGRLRAAFAEVIDEEAPRTIEVTAESGAQWLVRMIPLRPVEEVDSVLLIATDITERKRAEDARRLMESQLQRARRLESLGVLAGGLAHDFNNLLTGILGSASLAATKVAAGSAAAEQLDRILNAAQKAAELTNKMLAYAGKARFDMGPTDVNHVIEGVVPLVRAAIGNRIVLNLSLAPNLPQIEADPVQLQQVVLNLFINAAEALEEVRPAGGEPGAPSEILVRTGATTRGGDGSDASVFLEVRDEGVGMDDETRKRVFDPFFSTKFTGRGLGLAAVQGIVKAHRGTIQVESAAGRGATFTVLFPAGGRIPGTESMPMEVLVEGRSRPDPTRTILVVDDEETVREVARIALEQRGFSVLTAADGPSAVALLESSPERIDVALLDVTMPHLPGTETFDALLRIQPDLRVVVTSGREEPEVRERLSGRRFDFVQKPFRPRDLVRRIEEVLSSPSR